MEITVYRAAGRGHTVAPGVDLRHTFGGGDGSRRPGFGALRELNDITVAPGLGFGPKSLENMEVVSIPLDGVLLYRDDAGNDATLRPGRVQIVSAGSGVAPDERNGSNDRSLEVLEIWVEPDGPSAAPRYSTVSLDPERSHNALQSFVFPGGEGRIRLGGWFSNGSLDRGRSVCCELHDPQNGVFLFVVSGHVTAADTKLGPRDGAGIVGIDKVLVTADTDARVLLLEVPVK